MYKKQKLRKNFSNKNKFKTILCEKGYYSQPTIHRNKLVFVCENDLWETTIEGGEALRLTSSISEILSPFFSPDGQFICCSSKEEGEHDVYIMDSKGGPLQRLTWLNTVSNIIGWTNKGDKIIFRSSHEAIHNKGCDAWLYEVEITGGPVEVLPLGPAMTICKQPKGNKSIVLGRNCINNSRWKRYRGGMIGEIWVDIKNTGYFKRLLKNLKGNPVKPFWQGERIWFISDHKGIGNLFSCNNDGKDIRQETFQKKYYVRSPTSDGKTIVYHVGGELWKINPNEKSTPSRETLIQIEFRSSKSQLQRRFYFGNNFWEEKAIHPKGHEIALTVRGRLFSMPLWEEAVKQHGIRNGVRYRLPCWLSNGNLAVISDAYASDKKSNIRSLMQEFLEIFKSTPSENPLISKKLPEGRIQEMRPSPSYEHLAFTTSRMDIYFLIVNSGRIYKIDNSKYREISDLTFSPDGRWLAFTKYLSMELSAIFLVELNPSAKGDSIKPSKPIKITNPLRYDFSPSFDPGGRWIYFISSRIFNPIWDTVQTATSFSRSMKPYLIILKKNIQNPFIPKSRALGDSSNELVKNESEESKIKLNQKKILEKKPLVEIDLDGISNRIVEFPVSEGIFEQVLGLQNKVIFSEFPINNDSSDVSPYEKDEGVLWMYDFEKHEIEKITDEVRKIELSNPESSENKNQTMLYEYGNKIRAVEAGIPIPEDIKSENSPSRKSGWIDLKRIMISVDYKKEWFQMFHEAWRLQKEFFWTEDLSGVDWEKVYKKYVNILSRIGSRSELSDLIWEMQGELGTSHAYEYGGDYPDFSKYPVGFLGSDISYDKEQKSWFFEKIYAGDIWKSNAHSPLAAPGILVEEGDKLLSIGGIKVDENTTPGELLVNQAGQNISIKVIKNKKKESKSKILESDEVIIKTLYSEKKVRYREWVNNNLKIATKLSKGQIGYIHIPDMSTNGISEFHRGYLSQVDRKGLIIDVRYNAGGMVSPLILEKLSHRHLGYDVPRWGSPESYPYHTLRGYIVLIANQFTGSDGDMFTESFRQLKLGSIIGKRTWGGVIGIDSRYQLVDGTTTTQPQYSILFHNSGWSVENHGVEPDIEVEDSPQSYYQKEDLLLLKAINEILKMLKEKPLPSFTLPPSPKKLLP